MLRTDWLIAQLGWALWFSTYNQSQGSIKLSLFEKDTQERVHLHSENSGSCDITREMQVKSRESEFGETL